LTDLHLDHRNRIEAKRRSGDGTRKLIARISEDGKPDLGNDEPIGPNDALGQKQASSSERNERKKPVFGHVFFPYCGNNQAAVKQNYNDVPNHIELGTDGVMLSLATLPPQ
jgi:hypothetical protein